MRKPKRGDYARVCELVASGAPLEVACAKLGLDASWLTQVAEKAENGDPLERGEEAFASAYLAALAAYHDSLLSRLDGAKPNEWMKVAWLLERRFPRIYARPDRKEAKGENLRIEVVRDVPRPQS